MPNQFFQMGQGMVDTLGDARDMRRGVPGDKFYTRLKQGGDAYESMEKARMAQIQNVARVAISADLIRRAEGGDMQARAELGSNLMQTAQTPNLRNYTLGAGDMQEQGFKQQAFEALQGELGAGQAALAAAAGKPLVRNRLQGGYMVDPMVAGAEGIPTATATTAMDLQRERMQTEEARQGELGARAGLARVKADGDGFAPRAPARGDGGGSGKRSASESNAIIKSLEKQMNRPLLPQEIASVYDGGEFAFQDAPGLPAIGGRTGGQAPAGSKPPKGGRPPIPPQATADLLANPALKDEFARKYGPVAADYVLRRKGK